ncbi:beta-lactamase family protein [Tardiphaga sp. vice352]|uniref:serine hydrolase domain-containing protein n=1 Tax=unclassified Tardiphaga TaxID=2631404 RepID=UPI001162BB9A|nr:MULTISPECIES: serine hydrolase domain-containing protein [unclassified Tardiphaga]QDM16468.1 beta-lactamase family protein [Tardiphaga sp. vice278]QDM21491.1 beta-lactamase family protein [Tardiphaga sp. vice154]QDM26678.1 beta-lactamase family protein [Tardiphaga sp. vice304]QDM31744.1 beta-lactamase family protein [Tardiphaga sp. vice352]
MKRCNTDRRTLLLGLLSLGVASAARAETPPAAIKSAPQPARKFAPDLQARLNDYFGEQVGTGKIPGAIAMVQQHGRPVYFEAFGRRDAGNPMQPDAMFRLYSMSKPITSVVVMMLVEEGRLRLDDPLSTYIPAFAKTRVGIDRAGGDEHATSEFVALNRPITIEDLLRHTSGITYGFYGNDPARRRYSRLDMFDSSDIDNAELAERIARLPLAEQPGTLWDYGHSTDVLGRVIEVISGQPLSAFLKARLFDPLGMNDTSFYVTDEQKRPRIAEPFAGDRMLGPVVGMHDPLDIKRWEAGGSGLIGTISDYARFAQMLLNRGTLDGRRYLKPETIALMTSDHVGPGSGVKRDYYYFPGDGSGFGYGFAVRTKELASEPGPVGEYRWDGVGGTFFWIDPVDDMFVIVMMQAPSQRSPVEGAVRKIVYGALTN